METADSGGDDRACTGVGVKEVIKGEGVLGEEREEEEKVEVEGEGGVEEFVVVEDPFRRYFDGSGMPKADVTGARMPVIVRQRRVAQGRGRNQGTEGRDQRIGDLGVI